MGRKRTMKREPEKRYDVLVLKDGVWWKQTGEGNRWGNKGFPKEQADALAKRLIQQGIAASRVRVAFRKPISERMFP